MALFCFLLVHCFIVFVRSQLHSETHHEGSTSTASVLCSAECNQQLQNRLETIEAAVRTIVSAVSSQTDDLFAPIKEIFRQDSSVRSILSFNSTSSTIASTKNSTFKINSVPLAQAPNRCGQEECEKFQGCLETLETNLHGDDNTLNAKSINAESKFSLTSRSNTLILDWEDNSDCASQLTALNLKIFSDGEIDVPDSETASVKIPRNCLKLKTDGTKLFSLDLLANQRCTPKWKPLDACRKYAFEIQSEYSNNRSSGASFMSKAFTTKQGISPKNSIDGLWQCSAQKFFCRGIVDPLDPYAYAFGSTKTSGCLDNDKICNRETDCESGIDELNCAKGPKFWFIGNKPEPCTNGFQCGRQCISNELECDGKYDCLNGSDEHYDCEYSKSCSQLTGNFGRFSSTPVTPPNENIHKNHWMNLVRKSVVLITVQTNHTIWLAFYKFRTTENRFLKVYDGSYSTSPLLLSHSGTTKPHPVRSSSNNLYVEFPSYYDQSYGVEVFYTSMNTTDPPFVSGCGGYIYSDGEVTSPDNLSSISDVTDCIWFVEARDSEGIILLKRNVDLIDEKDKSTSEFPENHPIMTQVYDGWSSSGQVLYDERISPRPPRVIYSISHKIMIQFRIPEIKNSKTFNWRITTITPTVQYLVGEKGTLKSPNYPATYPDSSDFRWNIVTAPHTKIQLLFALLETQEEFDYLYVYDGPTINSQLLLEKSGSEPLPFAVNSSTNEVLVRLTSDEAKAFPGFLAVYSTL
ncbi:CUB and sushi domain-containing protein 3-like isoform X5 [Daphnia pulicaria]|uniref:CUB and sushi domain-containing protein 3-like isoform X5 n=1 Tax=Daphnia pulicaria TaxID=35523 RepID=UPI001EEB965B|nr:CUB and sushi domain-containing protein 3-like isoform X5 [Daphnia pulicaria]